GRWRVVADKPPEAAAHKQQRLLPVISVGFNGTEENHVIATIVAIGGAAFKMSNAVGDQGRLAKPRLPFHALELVGRGLGELGGERLLRNAKHINREMTGVLKDREPL